MDGNTKRVARETAKVLQDYLTYQAARTIILQLAETNPPESLRVRRILAGDSFQDSEASLERLLQNHKELALRILTVRENLAETALDGLKQAVSDNIRESNLRTRCQILERLTRSESPSSDLGTDANTDSPAEESDTE